MILCQGQLGALNTKLYATASYQYVYKRVGGVSGEQRLII